MPPPRRGPPITEADIPLPLDRPERSSFDSQAAFENAVAEYPAAAAQRMKERRKMKERLREQKRDRSGRDQIGRARPSDAGAKEVERRRKDPEAAKKHREREAARYEAKQPEVTEEDISLTRIVDAGEERPNWEYLKGAKVSERARKEIAKREAARKAADEAAVSVARREAAEAAAREEADPEAQARKRQRKADEEAAAAARRTRVLKEFEQQSERDTMRLVRDHLKELAQKAHEEDYDKHGELIIAWCKSTSLAIFGGQDRERSKRIHKMELDAARARAGMYCEHAPEFVKKCLTMIYSRSSVPPRPPSATFKCWRRLCATCSEDTEVSQYALKNQWACGSCPGCTGDTRVEDDNSCWPQGELGVCSCEANMCKEDAAAFLKSRWRSGFGREQHSRCVLIDRAMRGQCSACCAELRAKAQVWNEEWMAKLRARWCTGTGVPSACWLKEKHYEKLREWLEEQAPTKGRLASATIWDEKRKTWFDPHEKRRRRRRHKCAVACAEALGRTQEYEVGRGWWDEEFIRNRIHNPTEPAALYLFRTGAYRYAG